MSRKSGGDGSRSGGKNTVKASGDSEDGVVHVKPYTRADGTHVLGYTRAAPQKKVRNKAPITNSSNTPSEHTGANVGNGISFKQSPEQVVHSVVKASRHVTNSSSNGNRGRAQSNRTKLSDYAGKIPDPSCVWNCSTSSSRNYAGIIPDASSIRSSTPRSQNQGHSQENARFPESNYPRATKEKTTQSANSNNSIRSDCDLAHDCSGKCYVDNAYNRKLGRVGKPLRTCIVRPVSKSRKSQVHKKLLEESKLEDLEQAMKRMQTAFQQPDHEYSDYQYAIDQLQRDEVEENWKENCVEPSRADFTSLFHHYPGRQIPFGDLTLEKIIGRGGFGEVYASRLLGEPVAFKRLLYQQMPLKWKKNFSKEVTILATTDHPNIVKMLGYVNEENNIGIVMEYLQCSLYRAVFIDCTLHDVNKKKEIISQVACALNYLHTHSKGSIAHCDIKSENVLLDWSNNALLCDFGLSALKNQSIAMSTQTSLPGIVPPGQGTPRYSAPEVLRGELLTMRQLLKADIYSLAIVVFEVMAEEEPFEGLSIKQLEISVGHGNVRPTTAKLSQSLEDLLTECWDGDEAQRPTAAEFQKVWTSGFVACDNIHY